MKSGNYTCTITDSRGCTIQRNVTILEPQNITLSFSTTPTRCDRSDGEITVIATGGTGDFNYYWTHDGSLDSHLSNLKAGEYSVLVKDIKGCSVFSTAQIENTNGPKILSKQIHNAACFGGSGNQGGSAKIEIKEIRRPYLYEWTGIDNKTNFLSNARAGIYPVKITDGIGCITFDSILITEPDTFRVNVNVTNTVCAAQQGIAEAVLQGGTAPFIYQWSSSISNNSTIINLNSGEGSVIVTDSNGCSVSANYEILDIGGLAVTSEILSHAICFPDSGGTARVKVSNGIPPYTYSWFPQGGNNDIAYNLVSDEYTITVIDANGCRQKTTLIIGSPEELKLYFDVTAPSTDSSSDGKIVPIVYGGTPPYSYQWSNSSTSDFIDSLSLDYYFLVVTDANGCRVSAKVFSGTGYSNDCNRFRSRRTASVCNTFTISCPSPCTSITVNIKSDFGALGNGSFNDQCAFESACAFLSSLNPEVIKTLVIPVGTYIVGRQEPGYSFYLYGNGVLSFNDIENLTIQGSGVNSTILKFDDCMKYGSFDVLGGHPMHRLLSCPPCYSEINYSNVAFPGQMIQIHNGKNITVADLTLEGNLTNTQIGGEFPNGVAYDGIFLNACFNVNLRNLVIQNFGHDGIWINFDYCNQLQYEYPPWFYWSQIVPMNCNISNTKCLYNGRNGLTWAGGYGLYVSNSDFNYNGQTRISLAPRSGIDIEYENSSVPNANGNFQNINCNYNLSWGMTCNAAEGLHHTDYYSRDMRFFDSHFISSENGINAIPNSRNFLFNGCTFVGQIQKAFHSRWAYYRLNRPAGIYIAGNPNDNTKFEHGCNFLEEFEVSPGVVNYFAPAQADETCPTCITQCPVIVNGHRPVIDFTHSMGVSLENCNINTYFSLKWISLSTGINSNIPSVNWNVVRGCDFQNRGINMCDCDFYLGYFRKTDFQFISRARGMQGLNNQPSTSCGSLFYNLYDNAGCLNTQNFQGHPSSASYVFPDPTIPWMPLGSQNLSAKYIDPPILNQVTDLIFCPCSLSVPVYPSCQYTPRIKNQKQINENGEINMHPIPANEVLTVENISGCKNIKVINLMGQVKMDIEVNKSSMEIDISKLAPGVYILKADDFTSNRFIKL